MSLSYANTVYHTRKSIHFESTSLRQNHGQHHFAIAHQCQQTYSISAFQCLWPSLASSKH